MNGGTIALALAGLVGFFAGAYLSATGDRTVGIVLMVMGLLFQVLTLQQLKQARRKELGDE